MKRKLEALRSDFADVVGQPFAHFFCPILFRDEKSPLCRAHIVNAAFPKTDRRWTIQRRDVDNFYGSMFESDFVDLRHRREDIAAEAFVDPDLYQRLRPTIVVDGTEIDHFVVQGAVPTGFAGVEFIHGARTVRLALKISPDALSKPGAKWQIAVAKDIRLAAIVSVLKAAHLTLFEMLGYRYSLGLGGQFLGRSLGEFFRRNAGKSKVQTIADAVAHFQSLAAMVRPVDHASLKPDGSITNHSVRVCWCEGRNTLWGGIVFVRAGDMVHAALVPVFENTEGAMRFGTFLQSSGDTLETSVAKFETNHWSVARQRTTLTWPPAKLFD